LKNNNNKKTKIVATLGPVTNDYQSIKKLIKLGVNVIRLNFSHGSHEDHKENIKHINKACKELDTTVAILQDISGPKIRIGEIEGKLLLNRGDELKLSKNENPNDPYTLTLTYPSIIDEVKVGEEIYFADGTIKTVVSDKRDDTLYLKLLNDGKLTSRKGVNFPTTKLNIDVITPKDEKDLLFGAEMGVDIVALSFVQSKEDILTAKKILAPTNTNPMIFSKIETMTAINNLDGIIEKSDGIMVARGDLGAELGVEKVPSLQKYIISQANQQCKPTITATQMLLSMVNSPYPTRAEVSDVANAIYDGTDAVMLSDETTIGEFPFNAIEVLNSTILEAEKTYRYNKNFVTNKKEAISKSATDLAHNLDVDAIVAFTTSGNSAISISKYRPSKTIYAVTHDQKVNKKLNVVWGVEPKFVVPAYENTTEIVFKFLKQAEEINLFDEENINILATMGYVAGNEGNTNLIRILTTDAVKRIKAKFE
jgi:pyruvate kinase